MDTTDDLWATIQRVLPDEDALATAVAAELGEPAEDVRPTVQIFMVTGPARPASEADVQLAIEEERARVRTAAGPPPARLLAATTLDDLVAEARKTAADGLLDVRAILAIQRTAGAIAARADRRLVLFLGRYEIIRRLAWERCVDEMRAGRLDPDAVVRIARLVFLWNELTSLAVTDGYRAAERDILARDAEARRGALQELLGVYTGDAVSGARLRRVAMRHGLNPDGQYRLVAIAPRPEADPTPERPGIDHDDLELLAGRIGHLLGSAPPGAEGVGAGIRLPVVFPLHGLIAVLARHDWPGLTRIPTALDSVFGGPPTTSTARGTRAKATASTPPSPAWVAVGSPAIDGVGDLAARYADLVDATRTAQRLGLRGWIADPERLAVERLLLADRDLADAAVHRELGPLLADERMGDVLIETLQAYFDAGENMRETARRLHLATRTVAYRLEKIEGLLGGPVDATTRRRLSVALMVMRLRDATG